MNVKKFRASRVIVTILIVLSLVTLASATLPEKFEPFEQIGPAGICSSQVITSRVQHVLIVLGSIILVAVICILTTSFKYFNYHGKSEKGEKVHGSKKTIVIRIVIMVIMIVAVVGIIIVYIISGAKPTDPSFYSICLIDPSSVACGSCKKSLTGTACLACENAIETLCSDSTALAKFGSDITWDELIENYSPIGNVCK